MDCHSCEVNPRFAIMATDSPMHVAPSIPRKIVRLVCSEHVPSYTPVLELHRGYNRRRCCEACMMYGAPASEVCVDCGAWYFGPDPALPVPAMSRLSAIASASA